MKMKQKEQGITLVALIVTIIILIILAAVTIYAVTKNNFLGLATAGTQNYAGAQVDESTKMDDLVDKLEETLSNIESIQTADGEPGGNTPEEPEKPPVELPEAGTAVPAEGWSVEVAKGLVARDGLVAHLGEKVDYNPPAGGTWRIFYYDNEDQGNGKGYFGDPVGTVYLRRNFEYSMQVDLTGKETYSPTDNGAMFYQHNPLYAVSDDGEIDLEKEHFCSFLTDTTQWTEFVVERRSSICNSWDPVVRC